MSVRESLEKPEAMAHFPDTYRWMELHEQGDTYAHVAICERDENLEGHITFSRWGPNIRRLLRNDLDWFKAEARRLGKKRLLGIRADKEGKFDPNLFRFARLYGATECCVFQTVSVDIHGETAAGAVTPLDKKA